MKRRSLTGILFLFGIFFCLHQSVAAQQFRNTISGSVFDAQRRPVDSAYVELMNEVYSVLQRTRTNGTGRYFFGNLSNGRFLVRVLPLGTDLEEQTQEVEIINFVRPSSSGSGVFGISNEQKDFYLKPRRASRELPQTTGVIYAQDIPEAAKKNFEAGLSEMEKKNTDAAIKQIDDAIKIFPEYFAALERLGRIYLENKNYTKSVEYFSRAVKVNDRSLSSWYGLGVSKYALGKFSEAVEAGKKLTELSQSSFENHLLLGVALRAEKKYDESEKSLRQAEKLAKGTSPDVHWHLALLYNYNLKRYKDAAAELEAYLKLTPNNPDTEKIKKLIAELKANS